jgi:hypothetical protein
MRAFHRLLRSLGSLAAPAALVALWILVMPAPAAAEVACGVGNFVWHDLNRNGIQDAGEPGINGVHVLVKKPTGAVVDVVTANAPGSGGQPGYYSVGPDCGQYTVTIIPPAGFQLTTPGAGSDRGLDSNESPTVKVLASGADLSIDFGLVADCSGRIGDFVWNDLNQNGIQDSGEEGVSGVIVTLTGTNAHGESVSRATATSPGPGGLPGYYVFTGVCQGSYDVTVTRPAGFDSFSPSDQGLDDQVDSDGVPGAGGTTATAHVSLPSDATEDLTIDFGLVPPCLGAIGDFVWNDLNANGRQDVGEPGIGGAAVDLFDSHGVHLRSTSTGGDGYYQFQGFCTGSYTVVVTRPLNFFEFSPLGGAGDTLDSNGVPSADRLTASAGVTLSDNNSNDQTIDFGFYSCSGRIGDLVWNDLNRDGMQQGDEPGIPGVKVELRDHAGGFLQITITEGSGRYLFAGLCGGDYQVLVTDNVPPGLTPTTPEAGSDRGIDSNLSLAHVVLPSDVSEDLSIDFGFVGPITLGDRVWIDTNANGIQDVGEIGQGGVTVELLDCDGKLLQSTSTYADGRYSFTVVPGSYQLHFLPPPDHTFSPAKQGADNAVDSDADQTSGVVSCALYTKDTDTIDAGLVPKPASLGDFVWNDLNHDGIQDGGEPGIGGVTVTLTGPGGTQTTATDGTGFYQFTNLVAGSYTVTVGAAPAGFIATLAGAGTAATDSNGSPTAVVLAAGENNPTIDFGFWKPASLGDFVWNDQNHNGIQDGGEPGIGGVTVTLTGPDGTQTTTTNGAGFYQFTNLAAGSYTVTVGAVPIGFVATLTGAGTAATDSNGSPATVVLAAGEDNPTIDFGFWKPASLGDFVWHDLNHNGIQDSGEPGIGGVTVTLTGPGGTQATVTDGTGFYQFTNLAAGSYTVTVGAVPIEFVATLTGAGTAATDSNGSPTAVVLAAGENNPTIDFGFWKPVTLGNFVWKDVNANGVQDAGEPGVASVAVQLLDCSGTVVQTTTTNASGLYGFTVPAGGQYQVKFVSPAGYSFSPTGTGTPATDSNPNPATGVYGCQTYPTSDDTLDAGLFQAVPSIGLTKSVDQPTVVYGQAVTFKYVVTNTGTLPLTNVKVVDDNATPNIAGDDFTFGPIDLAPGAKQEFTKTLVPPTPLCKDTYTGHSPCGLLTTEHRGDGTTKFTYWQSKDEREGYSGWNGWSGRRSYSGKSQFRIWDKTGSSFTELEATSAGGDGASYYNSFSIVSSTSTVKKTDGSVNLPEVFHKTGWNGDWQKDWDGYWGDWSRTGRWDDDYYKSWDKTKHPSVCPGCVTNTATVTAAVVGTVTKVSASATAKVCLQAPAPPGISVTKTADKPKAKFGESVTYKYVVTNTGGTTLTNVVVVDDNATPTFAADDVSVGTVPSLAPGASVTFVRTLVPPIPVCSDFGGTKKCGVLITQHQSDGRTKFTYFQAKDERDAYSSGYGWIGQRSYSRKALMRVWDKSGTSYTDVSATVGAGDGSQYFNSFSILVNTSTINKGDGSVNVPDICHRTGWNGDWRQDWDRQWGDWYRNQYWDDHSGTWDRTNCPKPCPNNVTNKVKVTASAGTQTVSASDSETVYLSASGG